MCQPNKWKLVPRTGLRDWFPWNMCGGALDAPILPPTLAPASASLQSRLASVQIVFDCTAAVRKKQNEAAARSYGGKFRSAKLCRHRSPQSGSRIALPKMRYGRVTFAQQTGVQTIRAAYGFAKTTIRGFPMVPPAMALLPFLVAGPNPINQVIPAPLCSGGLQFPRSQRPNREPIIGLPSRSERSRTGICTRTFLGTNRI